MGFRFSRRISTTVGGCILACLVGCAVEVHTEPVDWLFDVQVDVDERTRSSASIALQKALRTCLMRVSGVAEVADIPVVLDALQDPSAYLIQYRFTTAPDRSGGSKDILVANFDEELIQQLARLANLPVWPVDRPTVLLWMSHRDRTGLVMLQSGEISSMQVEQRARERGIEIVLPLMDLTDRQRVTRRSVEGGFWIDVREASTRYSADLVVAVSSKENVFGEARILITMWYGATEFTSIMQMDDVSHVGSVVVDHIVDFVSNRSAIGRESQQILRLRIAGIDSVRAYAQLLSYLDRLEFVDRYEIMSYTSQWLELEVYTPSLASRFEALVESDSELTTMNIEAREGIPDSVLHYAWQGER